MIARLARVAERACGDADLTLPQYRLLAFVSRQPQRAGDLATRAAVSRPTLTALVDGLERQGWLRRTPVEGDRRGIQLVVTPAGADVLARADRTLAERLGRLVHDAGVPEILDHLTAIGAVLDREREERLRNPVP